MLKLPLLAIVITAGALVAAPTEFDFFEKNIRPLLVERCYKCHSSEAQKAKGGLLLDTREGIREGGDSGHAVVPGEPDDSLLIKALLWTDKELRMPPEKEGGKLSDKVIADFRQWVKMGAPDPREGEAKTAKREIDPEKAKQQLWTFQRPQAAPPPALKDTAWPRTDVDRFIRAAHEARGIAPVGDADARTLVRRLYFDLVGLPPPPEIIEEFVRSAGAASNLSKLVDRLLASPQFGERWGRHWLDVARYAESTGKERNHLFSDAWRYRDYVIAAFNADLPYDQFLREQIAGDLLPSQSSAERDRRLIATGFLALGTKDLAEKKPQQFRADLIDEQIDTVSRAVLGTTVACARCHDHKFDPISQRDYYAMAGIFLSSDTHYGTSNGGGKNRNPSSLIPLATAAPVASSPQKVESAPLPKKGKPGKPGKKQKAARRFDNIATAPASTGCLGVLDARPADARLLARGEIDQPGERIARGFVAVLTHGTPPAIPSDASGRLQLADWLTSADNALTARVMVNRVWQHLFGEGFVRTPDNFGATGEAPSHPELLDFLAVRFMRDGWSVKRLIRDLVLSRTYALSSVHESQAGESDPDNRFLWHAATRRLDAEAIHDTMLAASGQLDLTPPAGSIVATMGDAAIGRGVQPEAFTEYQTRHRAVYFPVVRDFVPKSLELFDFAEPSLVVASRDVTNVASQALYLLNNSFVREQAAAMATRVLASPLDFRGRIDLAHRLALGRPATAAEHQRAHSYLLGEATALIPARNLPRETAAQQAWATLCQALFACAEFRFVR
jgi:hypothetical protein